LKHKDFEKVVVEDNRLVVVVDRNLDNLYYLVVLDKDLVADKVFDQQYCRVVIDKD
jgi:hypothetical protein